MSEKPLGRRNYEQFADRFAASVATKPYNAFYDRPAMLGLLPEVSGKRVLDAGCGPGIYTEELVNRGAHVVGVDVTPDLVAIARERLGGRATILEADLEQPLAFASNEAFDLVLSALVLDYVADWESVMREFARLLKPGGTLLFSCEHPMVPWQLAKDRGGGGGGYFAREQWSIEWHGVGEPYPVITGWRRPLGGILQPVIDSGFQLERIVEPRPTEGFREVDPGGYEKLMREPSFLCVRAQKA